jgi:hypothetical protein
MTPIRQREIYGEMGEAMRALPNERWRDFVRHSVIGKPRRGAAAAYRAAGLGLESTPLNQAREAYKLLRDDRVIAAVAEESKKYYRIQIPAAVQAVHDIIANPDHRDRARVAMALIDRVDPIVTRHELGITHRIVDPDQEALEELKAARQLGATREKLLQLFGPNGLDRLEALEAAEHLKRSATAKVIKADEVIQTAPDTTSLFENDPDPEMLGDE